MASVNEVRTLLAETSMPQETIDDSLDGVSAVWLMSANAELLAGDLVLCHPPIGPADVRALAHPLADGGMRLTVVAHDRPGLLAATAAVLAAEGLSISAASAISWTSSRLALHSLTVAEADLTADRWARLSGRLQTLGTEEPPAVSFVPIGRATVRASPSSMGRCVVTVAAPDQVGLLWAICDWFADQDVSIEAARIGVQAAQGADVRDDFLVVGQPDVNGLRARLTGSTRKLPGVASEVAGALVGVGAGLVRRLAARH